MRRTLLPASLALACGCAVVSPPPMLMMHDPVLRPQAGAISVAAIGGAGAGVFTDDFAGGVGRVEYQVTDEVAVGLSGGGGAGLGSHPGRLGALGSGRAHLLLRPEGSDWVSFRTGLGGGGGGSGLAYLTGDAGFGIGHTFTRRIRVYGGLAGAVSVPVRPGRALADDDGGPRTPATTLHLLAGLGLAVRIAGTLDVSAEATGDGGWAMGNGESLGAMAVTGGLRYTFGPAGTRERLP